MHRTLAPFAEVKPALLLVFCTNLAWRTSFSQRTAAHSSAQLLWDTIEKASAPFMQDAWDTAQIMQDAWDTILGHNF